MHGLVNAYSDDDPQDRKYHQNLDGNLDVGDGEEAPVEAENRHLSKE